MSRMNVQTNDKSPILQAAHEWDSEDSGRFSGTGIVYPSVEPRGPADIITIVGKPPLYGQSVGITGRMSKGALVVFIAVINVATNVLMNVSLPVFAGTMDVVGGDTFVVLVVSALFFPVIFFLMAVIMRCTVNPTMSFRPGASWKVLFIMGLLTTLNGVFVVFASPPDRTPPYLQGILATTTIPYTVIARFLILRKGISMRRLACTITVLVGLFITIEPQIWGLKGSGVSNSSTSSGIGNVIWPLIFALGFLPAGISGVICEKELKTKESESLTFIMWTQVFQLLTILPLFWVDFIPFFGMTDSIDEFSGHLRRGLLCCFSSDPTCNGLAWKVWLFFTGYCLGNLFQFLLIEYAEGAVYAVVVQSLVTPLATLFWTLFQFDPPQNHFFWNPRFNITTVFTLGGLLIIVPSIIMYNYFSKQDAKEKKIQENAIRDVIANHM